ncbi:MAG: hypothetical protein ACLFRG_11395 [Desulfococcaceae bacterium]
MKAYRVEKEIAADGVLQLDALPFLAGERVEIIILTREENHKGSPASIRGKVLKYIDPAEPVAEGDWDAMR